jgi:hypothetical protein
MKSNRLTIMVLLAMVLGVVVGYLVHANAATPETAKDIAGYFGILTDVFLRMIKMIIAPWCLPRWWRGWPIWAMPALWAAWVVVRWAGLSRHRSARCFWVWFLPMCCSPATA